jgi:UDP-perosamine 4-acetyltransferase
VSDSRQRSVVVLGGGGHSRVVIDTLLAIGRDVVGLIDPNSAIGESVLGVPALGDDDVLSTFEPGSIDLANGVGSTHDPTRRADLFRRWTELGHRFTSLVHPTAVVARDVTIHAGAQLMAGVIVQTGSSIGENSILNTAASIDHDCVIGAHVHIAPGATLSGGVVVGEGAHIGTGAIAIHGVRIGNRATIGAGAAVIGDVPDGVVAVGVPARATNKPR